MMETSRTHNFGVYQKCIRGTSRESHL